MRIVCLDAVPMNPGDLDWSPLEALGELTRFDATPAELTAERIADADVVLTNKVRLDAALIHGASNLKLIAVLATGYDVVDLDAARSKGVVVSNVPAYSTASTAQVAIALLLELTHRVGLHSDAVHAGEWCKQPAFAYWKTPLVELDGKHLVVAGYGAIGSRVADAARALGMRVSAVGFPGRDHRDSNPPRLSVEESFRQADVLSLHCPLTDETRHIVNASTLALMKPTAFVVNAGRGPLVDEHAMAAALRAKQIAGYGTDVLSQEPPPPDHPLFGIPNCIITPHYGWGSRAARSRLLGTTVENIRAFAAGAPQNVVR